MEDTEIIELPSRAKGMFRDIALFFLCFALIYLAWLHKHDITACNAHYQAILNHSIILR